jgi:hypothetical protein
MLYAQEIEQRRRDVKVVDINLLRRSWYFDYLKHAHPGLMDRSSECAILRLLPGARSLLKGLAWHSWR